MSSSITKTQTLLGEVGITLLPHQLEALEWLNRRESEMVPGGIIADEMGLGKTLEIISLLLGSPVQNTLVIVPANLIEQWVGELKKFAPSITPRVNEDFSEEATGTNNVYISSFVKGSRNSSYHSVTWDRIVVDEAHYIRNQKGVTYKSLYALPRMFTYLLTGTPIHNKFGDIAALIKFIGIEDIPTSIESRKALVEQFVLRRTLEEVHLTLPNLDYKTHKLHFIHSHEKKIYRRVMNNALITHDMTVLERCLRLRQAALLPRMISNLVSKNTFQQNTKLDCILSHLKKTKRKVIVFCYFVREIEYLYKGLEGYNVDIIDGSVPMCERKEICENPDTNILLVNIMAGGTGLNLTNYNTVYFTGPHWNPTLEQQAIARVYRIGQKEKVEVKRFIMKHTIEEDILVINANKIKLINTFIKEKQ